MKLALSVMGWIPGCSSEAQKFELTVADNNPSGSPIAQLLDAWADEVSAKSDGRLEPTVYHDEQLLSGHEGYRGVQTGVADIALYVLDGTDDFLLNTVVALPFMGWPEQLRTREIYLGLLNAYPEMQHEWKAKIIGTWMMPGTQLHNVEKVVRLPVDLKGMRTVGAEAMTAEAARAAGAIPVQLDMSELHDALSTGKVEAIINHFPTLKVFGVLDLLKFHTVFQSGINMTPNCLIINNDVFDNLPSDLQTVLLDGGDYFRDKMAALDATLLAEIDQEMLTGGHSVQRLTSEETQVWYELVKPPIHDTWIAVGENRGLPAQAIYDDALLRIQEANESP
jgi:TRAP-type C4-dicarboxylate transport system substrate-binding protein